MNDKGTIAIFPLPLQWGFCPCKRSTSPHVEKPCIWAGQKKCIYKECTVGKTNADILLGEKPSLMNGWRAVRMVKSPLLWRHFASFLPPLSHLYQYTAQHWFSGPSENNLYPFPRYWSKVPLQRVRHERDFSAVPGHLLLFGVFPLPHLHYCNRAQGTS